VLNADIVPLLLVVAVSLLLALSQILLNPLYNSIPLSLHTVPLFAFYVISSSLIYWYLTLHRPAREIISARVCACIAALGGDLMSVSGRRVGSGLGRMLGGRLGAVFSQGLLGIAVVGGSTAFALLCFVSGPCARVDFAPSLG
jgi:hypothetical protein